MPPLAYLNLSSLLDRGEGISNRCCAGDGNLTLERRPISSMGSWTSRQAGASGEACVQWATAASSHQSGSRGMIFRWIPEFMKARMDDSSLQTVQVQKARLASASVATWIAPGAALAWRAERKAATRNAGRNRQARTRSRVTDTSGILDTVPIAGMSLRRRSADNKPRRRVEKRARDDRARVSQRPFPRLRRGSSPMSSTNYHL